MLLPNVSSWKQEKWSQYLTVENWEKSVRQISRIETMPFDAMKAGIPSGSNATFVLDEKYVVKIFPPWLEKDIHVEVEILEILNQRPGIPAPKLLATGILEDQINWPYFIMECIPGVSINKARDRIGQRNLLSIATHLGEIMRAFHHIDTTGIGNIHPPVDNWKAAFIQGKEDAKKEIREAGHLPFSLRDELLSFLSSDVEECIDGPPVLLHGELCADHLLLTEKDGQWSISGLIDFAGGQIGPGEFEWADLWLDLLARNSEAMCAFMSAYDPNLKVDAQFCRKGMILFLLCNDYGPLGAAIGPFDLVEWVQSYGKRADFPPVNSLQEFQDMLWPANLWKGD